MMHYVELEKQNTARYKHLSYTNQTKGVIGPLLRKAIEEGLMKEDDMVTVLRDGKEVFLPCKVCAYTAYGIREDDKGLRRVKYKPFNM